MSEEKKEVPEDKAMQEILDASKAKVPIGGYIALIFAFVFFAGIFADARWGWARVFDFTVISGGFGTMANTVNFAGETVARTTFVGAGGTGARHGFLFALTLLPIVMFALGMVELVDHWGGLKAGQKILTPLLRPLMGIPGICALGIVSSFQSTDAGAGMIKTLRQANFINEKEKTIFAGFQFSAGGTLTNFLGSGAAVFAFLTVPILMPMLVIFVMKVFGANLIRLYLTKFDKKGLAEEAN